MQKTAIPAEIHAVTVIKEINIFHYQFYCYFFPRHGKKSDINIRNLPYHEEPHHNKHYGSEYQKYPRH